jgi:hypothetical protein
MKDLFKNAKDNSTKKKVEKYEVVEIPILKNKLERINKINSDLANLEAEKAIIYSEIRNEALNNMIKLYNKSKKFPGTLKIKAGKMNFQFITADNYKKIDEDSFKDLSKKYNKDLVSEETKYFFNNEILMKYMNVINKALLENKNISEDDKEKILESEIIYSIKKGTINELFNFVKKDVTNIIDDIQPVFQIKAIKEE